MSLLRDEQGRITFIVATGNDVTAQHAAEATLRGVLSTLKISTLEN
jgi:hypothetical protein